MKYFLSLFFIIIIFVFSIKGILASDQNIFGLHLTQTSDIYDASKIINSSGGDWGWATIVIRMDQMDRNTWQDFFDNCRKYHIVPILRIATIQDQGNWAKPKKEMIDQIAAFLNSLNWPTKTQYIILFNEVNHAQEWGGGLNPQEYADIAIYASQVFKEKNKNFFILSAALDLASPDKSPEFLSAATFYKQILNLNKNFFDYIDGIASHSYPNHGFIGKPTDTGQHSVHGYSWELDYLKNLGISKTFPVFITETGWPHREGESKNNKFFTSQTTSDFLLVALSNWRKDNRVKAVTPFIYNYPYEPFDNFSWLDVNANLYPQYQKLIDLKKDKNTPQQIFSFQFISIDLPLLIFPNKEYRAELILKNNGQSIWGEQKKCLLPQTTEFLKTSPICLGANKKILPGGSETIQFSFKIDQPNKQLLPQNHILSWENIPKYEITSFNPAANIYHPKTGITEKFSYLFNKYLIKFRNLLNSK